MNKRINQFETQAMSIVLNGDDPDGDIDKMYIPREFTKKFAELIVRECAQFVEDKFDFIGDEIIVKEKMLEHFGIEE